MKRLFLAVAAMATCGLLALTGSALAGGADTIVTIKEQNGDFSGQVKSPKPNRCADERKVKLYTQKGQNQDPEVDKKVASDITEKQGDRYKWSTGNTHFEKGKFYAYAPHVSGCHAGYSETVKV